LHYGYWRPNEEINLDNLKKAQERYVEYLLKFIPEQVKTILDVGCGVGDIATALAKKGYQVIGITPDKYQYRILTGINNENVSFKLTKFENFWTIKKFDCILMSESANYFDMDIGLKKSKDLLEENGYLLVANIFRKARCKEFDGAHIESEWSKFAQKIGFKIIQREDITENILPTLAFGEKIYREYLTPIEEIIDGYFKQSSPIRVKIIELLFAKDIRRLFSVREYLFERLNSKLFYEKARYIIYLLQKCNV
jgi:cyclopropane fatty-acyl-phospholipid synthase-like methyltransferase